MQMKADSQPKNICPYCGGPLVIEFIGSYGSVYPLKKNGKPGKRRLRRILYEESSGDFMIYCEKCGKVAEGADHAGI